MSIITINRGSYSRGKEVAEKLALKLGYECISRDILLEASDEFNIPERGYPFHWPWRPPSTICLYGIGEIHTACSKSL